MLVCWHHTKGAAGGKLEGGVLRWIEGSDMRTRMSAVLMRIRDFGRGVDWQAGWANDSDHGILWLTGPTDFSFVAGLIK